MAQVIISEGLGDAAAADALTGGGNLDQYAPEIVAGDIGTDAERIKKVARDFATHRPSLAIGGGSAAAHTNGKFNLNAIYALNYLVGSVGVPGGVIFNPEPALDDAPTAPASASFGDWWGLAEEMRQRQVEILMVRGSDPVYGLPDGIKFKDALLGDEGSDGEFNVPLIVSFSGHMDDTTTMADMVLPEHNYLEDWGGDIPEPGPGYQVMGFQQPVVNPLYEIEPQSFPDILLAMGQELGKETELPWPKYQDLLREGSDALFSLNRGSIQASSADEFWTKLLQRGGWWDEGAGGPQSVAAPNGLLSRIASQAKEPQAASAGSFYLTPFAHNSLLDGRNAHLPWLQGTPDPLTTITWQTWVEISDRDARELRVKEGDVLLIESSGGSIRAPAYPTPAVPPGTVSVPLGQGRRHGSEYATDRPGWESSNVMDVLEPNQVEGTGALAWANTQVRISKTGESVKVSKFEGIVRAVEVGILPGERIIRTITPEQL
jgi:anaerobic selenocysteine-containing dehydrogenase